MANIRTLAQEDNFLYICLDSKDVFMKRILALFLAFALTICASARPYTVKKDIQYRSGIDQCLLDVAYMRGATDRPVIVWFHGGGLTAGHRDMPQELLAEDYTVVDVEYRLYPEVSVNEILEDAAAAVAWVCNNIEGYGGSKDKIYLSGHSAGGYIVDMLALDKSWLQPYGIDPDKFAGIVPYSGQVITHYTQRSSEGIGPLTPTLGPLAPLSFVRGDAAPFLVISGDREMELYGRYEETAYFVRMLRLNGHKDVIFYELDGFDHGAMARPAHFIFMNYIRAREK